MDVSIAMKWLHMSLHTDNCFDNDMCHVYTNYEAIEKLPVQPSPL